MQNDNIIEFQNVSYRYEADDGEEKLPLVVNNISLNFKKGDFIAILGHNGSGKSTLAKLSNSILIPESGKVLVNGMDTADEDLSYDIRRTVGDNALKAVGMYEYRGHEPHKLSGGQKQRVAIAGIIAMLPECIVLDEPTAMLDPRGRKEVMDTCIKLNREMGMTVVFITHFMEEAVLANRVIVMDDAKIILDGTPKQVFHNSELLKKVGLDVPETAKLANDLRESGAPLPEDILSADEFSDEILKLLRRK